MAPRKRTHAQHDDDLAPPAPTSDALSSTKKRRLNGSSAPPPAEPKGLSAIASAIGTVLGYGRRSSAKPTASAKQQNATSKSAYDETSGSDDEETAVSARKQRTRPAVSYTKLNQKPAKVSRQASKDLYDVPSSGDELEFSTPVGGQSNTPVTTKQGRVSAKKSGGRSAKSAEEEDVAGHEAQGTPSRARQKRENAGAVAQSVRKPAVKDFPASQSGLNQGKSPTKQQHPTPKGILTPRHKRPGRPRKSVAFDSEDNIPTEVFFEDLPTKSKLDHPPSAASKKTGNALVTKKAVSAKEEEEESEESEDEEVCVICSKPDSKRGNEIIFCDNCNKAVHQKCYNVPDIPEDDWFCRDCLQEDIVTQKSEQSAQTTSLASTVPEIDNFEKHLKTMQRVLIDRCSGNRRLKLKGQDEAFEKAYQLVEQTVMAGEGNSMMIIGARGCGKTLLVETIVSQLAAESQDAFHVVRLNGFIHTDDKLALKEIWRQLGKEMEIEDEMNKVSVTARCLGKRFVLTIYMYRPATMPTHWLRF